MRNTLSSGKTSLTSPFSSCADEVVPERLLDDHPAPLVAVLLAQP